MSEKDIDRSEDFNANGKSQTNSSDNLWRKRFISLVLVSFVVGALGGIFGYRLVGEGVGDVTFNSAGTKTFQTVEQQSAIIDAVKKINPAVVSITASTSILDFFGRPQTSESAGTGFIVDKSGLIVTNKHVVSNERADYSVFTSDGKEYQAKVVARDSLNDIAFVKIEGNDLPVATLGDSEDLQLGQTVIAVGYALGQYENSVTSGIVSGIGRNISASDSFGGSSEVLDDVIQTDAAINSGNSGGPLVDISGQVIGINTAVASAENIGFALPINDVKKQVSSVISSGKIIRPYIGIRYVPITKEYAARNDLDYDYGILIYGGGNTAVAANSPAASAGIKTGDIILKIGNDKIDDKHSLSGLLQKYNPKDKVTLTILRDGREIQVDVILGES